nr:hypothetical protein [uncultured Psychroserpens sp.]
MKSSTLLINGAQIDKSKLLQLLKNKSKLHAIKRLREDARISLKESKEIIEALEINPDFQPNDNVLTATAIEFEARQPKPRRGSHIIKENASRSKNMIIVLLVLVISILLYFVTIK